MRQFARLGSVFPEMLDFSLVKMSHSASAVFGGSCYDLTDKQLVFAEFQVNLQDDDGKLCVNTHDTLKDIFDHEDHKNASVYLALLRVTGPTSSDSHTLLQRAQSVSIPGSVAELCNKCFHRHKNLSRAAFHESSSLKRIGIEAFFQCSLKEIHIPDSVEELCDKCFFWCNTLSRVTFGESSLLKRIGTSAFYRSGLKEIHIPFIFQTVLKSFVTSVFSSARVFHVSHLVGPRHWRELVSVVSVVLASNTFHCQRASSQLAVLRFLNVL